MKEKSVRLYEAITELDDRFVLEARRREVHWKPWAGLAAALVLVVVSWPMFLGFFAMGGGNTAAPSAPAGSPGTPSASAPDSSAPAATAPDAPSYGGSALVELENGEQIELQMLDEKTAVLTNPTDADWTGTVRVGDYEFEQTILAGETVTLDLEDLP